MNKFAEFVCDTFADLGDIHCRKMFGGYGVYCDGLMFGLVADDVLYLKAGPGNAELFREKELEQFEYPRGGKMIKMSYYQAPEVIFEDQQEAVSWGRKSVDCARSAKKNKI